MLFPFCFRRLRGVKALLLKRALTTVTGRAFRCAARLTGLCFEDAASLHDHGAVQPGAIPWLVRFQILFKLKDERFHGLGVYAFRFHLLYKLVESADTLILGNS